MSGMYNTRRNGMDVLFGVGAVSSSSVAAPSVQNFTYLPQGAVVTLKSAVNGQRSATVASPMQIVGGRQYYQMILPGGSNEFPNTAAVATSQIASVVSLPASFNRMVRATRVLSQTPLTQQTPPPSGTYGSSNPSGTPGGRGGSAAMVPTTSTLPPAGDKKWLWVAGGVAVAAGVGLGLLSFFGKKKVK